MIIDGLVPDKRRPGSIRVLVAGKPAWTVPADVTRELALVVGAMIPSDVMERLDAAADEEGTLRAGMRLLARRAHGREELRRKLARKGHGDEAIAAALLRLDRLGLMDDAVFAAEYATSLAGRGRGPERIRRDLSRIGVSSEVAQRVVTATVEHEGLDPWQRTLEQGSRRAGSMRGLPRIVRQRRLIAFFARRGFRGDEARDAIRGLLRDSGVPEL